MNKIIITLVVFLSLPILLFSQQIKSSTVGNKKEGKNPVEFKLALKAAGGGLFNYNEYAVNSPLASASALADLNFLLGQNGYLKFNYEAEGVKLFESVPGTIYTLDQLQQQAQLKLGLQNNTLDFEAKMKYRWMLRPSWPDLYQPNPLVYGAASDPDFGSYLPTDRNSYHRLEPVVSLDYKGIQNVPLSLTTSYIRNLEYVDPNYSASLPSHLPPTTYSAFNGEIAVIFKTSDSVHIKLANETEYRTYDFELARDSVTGKTHYTKTPNPLYQELGNKTTLGFDFILASIGMKIKPFASLDINIDLFQGYYSYTGITPGIEIQQKAGGFAYKIKFAEELQFFGPNSYDVNKTTDGASLYKYLTRASVNLKYSFNKHVESFIDADMVLKETNYPAYVPGVNPKSKNYAIDFNFKNYSIVGGVIYNL